MFKKVLIHTRRSIKFIVLFMVAAFLILGAVAFYINQHIVFLLMENKWDIQKINQNYKEK